MSDVAAVDCKHPDCDGWRSSHRVEIVCEWKHGTPLYTAVCAECGPVHIGSAGSVETAKAMSAGHYQGEIRCDGRCSKWDSGN